MHGIRVTAASLQAGRRALGLSPPMAPRRRRAAVDEGTAAEQEVEAVEKRTPVPRPRSAGVESVTGGVEQMLREFVAGAEEERVRLREAIRRVIEVVDEALG